LANRLFDTANLRKLITPGRRMIKLNFESCLVTGGAGFIGSHICSEALEQGLRVVCLDNLVSGNEDNMIHLNSNPNFTFIKADVSDLDSILPYFGNIDVVFHNAASKNTVCRIDPRLDLDVNAWGAWCVAEASRLSGVKKLVHASTGSVYGELVVRPQSENHPLNPRSFYGVSKLAGERYLGAFAAYYPDFRFSIIRYYHVFGSRQSHADTGGVIPIFVRQALNGGPITINGDGSQIRSFTSVKDDVNANFALANSTDADGRAFNAASSVKVSIQELAHKVRDILGVPETPITYHPWRSGDILDFDVDTSALAELGVAFSVDFDEALTETVNWYRGLLT